MFCISGPNLVILAWMGDELSSGQARDCYTHTHGHTDPQTQAMTIPEGQNWPRVKIDHGRFDGDHHMPHTITYERTLAQVAIACPHSFGEWLMMATFKGDGTFVKIIIWLCEMTINCRGSTSRTVGVGELTGSSVLKRYKNNMNCENLHANIEIFS